MSTFNTPVMEYVVNDPLQLTPLFYNPSGTSVTVFNAGHRVDMFPVFADVYKEQVKKREKILPVLGTSQVMDVTITGSLVAGDRLIVNVVFFSASHLGDNVNNSGNRIPQKFFISVDTNLTAVQTAQRIYNQIVNSESYVDMLFTVSIAGAVLTFTAKDPYFDFDVFIDGVAHTKAITTARVTPIGTYKDLIRTFSEANIKQYQPIGERLNMPQPNKTYVTYYWEIEKDEASGGHSIAGAISTRQHRYRVYVDSTLTALISELDDIIP